jgi:transcriptional regulator with XRE-family HTH domain
MRSANDIDKTVGENLCKFRLWHGMTQGELGEAVGVTFQQIQKYENGRNRISASRLWEFSKVLKIPVEVFYDGVEGAAGSEALTLAPEQLGLMRKYKALTRPQQKSVENYMRFLRQEGR